VYSHIGEHYNLTSNNNLILIVTLVFCYLFAHNL